MIKTTKLPFQINDVTVIIEVKEWITINSYEIPTYRSVFMRGEEVLGLCRIDKDEFEDEVMQILPKTLNENYMIDTSLRFQRLINDHITTYGRLLEGDLLAYIGEFILVIISIQKAMSFKIISIDERKALFSRTFDNYMNYY